MSCLHHKHCLLVVWRVNWFKCYLHKIKTKWIFYTNLVETTNATRRIGTHILWYFLMNKPPCTRIPVTVLPNTVNGIETQLGFSLAKVTFPQLNCFALLFHEWKFIFHLPHYIMWYFVFLILEFVVSCYSKHHLTTEWYLKVV